jgi:vancomycin permeability regulator SanA
MTSPGPARFIRAVVVGALLGMSLIAGAVAIKGLTDRVASADAVIVPGNTVHPDGTLSDRLRARLDVALGIYRAGRCKLIFVSGATGAEGVDEAAAMKAYLVRHGVPAERVLQDSAGFNTEATARNAAQALRQQGYTTVIAASQFFHVVRLNRLLAAQGLVVSGHEHARYFEPRDAYSLLREVAALAAMAVR